MSERQVLEVWPDARPQDAAVVHLWNEGKSANEIAAIDGRHISLILRLLRRGGRVSKRPLRERFWAKVNRTDGCWLWTGHLSYSGYGHYRVGPVKVGAHRMAYQLAVGPIPDGLVIDHLCRVRHCVNPAPPRSGDSSRERPQVRPVSPEGGRRMNDAQDAESYRWPPLTPAEYLEDELVFCRDGVLLKDATSSRARCGVNCLGVAAA